MSSQGLCELYSSHTLNTQCNTSQQVHTPSHTFTHLTCESFITYCGHWYCSAVGNQCFFYTWQTRGFLGNPQAEVFDRLSCRTKVRGGASDLLVIRKKGLVANQHPLSPTESRLADAGPRSRSPVLVAAAAAELREGEDDQGRLRCVQDAGVLLHRLLPLRRPSLLSGRLQPRRLLPRIHPQPEQPEWR